MLPMPLERRIGDDFIGYVSGREPARRLLQSSLSYLSNFEVLHMEEKKT